jgi:hypothetical protein
MAREPTKAVAYLRTSSKTNVGPDKDCDKRQLATITAYAKANGFEVVDTFYDAAVSGADPVTDRAGFAEMLERLMSNGARTIIVESPDRFARDREVALKLQQSASQSVICALVHSAGPLRKWRGQRRDAAEAQPKLARLKTARMIKTTTTGSVAVLVSIESETVPRALGRASARHRGSSGDSS